MVYVNSEEIVFLGDECDNVALLSPQLYWWVQKSFPFRNIAKVQKLVLKSAKGSFEDANEAFCIELDNGEFSCFCFDKQSLQRRFKQAGLEIEKIYFASMVFQDEHTSIQINETLFLNPLGQSLIQSTQALGERTQNLQCALLESLPFMKLVQTRHENFFVAALVLVLLGFGLHVGGKLESLNASNEALSAVTSSGYKTAALIRQYEQRKKSQTALKEAFLQEQSFEALECKESGCVKK